MRLGLRLGAPTPKVGADHGRNFFGMAWGGRSSAVISASYGRFFPGACMPV